MKETVCGTRSAVTANTVLRVAEKVQEPIGSSLINLSSGPGAWSDRRRRTLALTVVSGKDEVRNPETDAFF